MTHPASSLPLTVGDVGSQGWSVLDGDLPLPLAVIRQDILAANSAWMSAFTAGNDLVIAPHGKTTMAPHLFDLQIADGAWAITAATLQQVEVCRRFGVKRVLLANQPAGRQAVDACFRALQGDAAIELYCLADSLDGVAMLAEAATRNPPPAGNPLRILIEMGFEGGRTGVRSRAGALEIARAVAAAPGLELAGFECFEGMLPTAETADGLIDDVAETALLALQQGLYTAEAPIVISAGGSAFFDRVVERFNRVSFPHPVLRVLRSGCYLTHDSIAYAAAFRRIVDETTLTLPEGGLEPALEVWAHVQSRPEPGRTMLTMGKRDVSHDAGLPVPLRWYRPDGSMDAPADMPPGHQVVALNDQHCHLVTPPESPLKPGDLVGFGISHPCTTFDKWSVLMLVDEDYRVTRALKTFF
ncbi:MAG: amino acid aldolase [Kaistia sp. SCN 65-12]|nr:MAG: amino acid aldolase [Kaistia sp. SCN 65-12]